MFAFLMFTDPPNHFPFVNYLRNNNHLGTGDYQGKRVNPLYRPHTQGNPSLLFLDMVPSSSRMLLARCVNVFVEDLFMFRFVSKQRKASNAVGMFSLIF